MHAMHLIIIIIIIIIIVIMIIIIIYMCISMIVLWIIYIKQLIVRTDSCAAMYRHASARVITRSLSSLPSVALNSEQSTSY